MDTNELLQQLGRDLNLSHVEVMKVIASAPFRYKYYQIPKRSGGFRDIYHPTPELKAIQRLLVKRIYGLLPVHDAVYSYRKHRSIRDHAALHVQSRYFLRFDFTDFFPSITYSDVLALLVRSRQGGHIDLDDKAASLVALLTCRAPKGVKLDLNALRLTIGAPSSPAVSNAILLPLDQQFETLALTHDALYSRYADDLHFSSQSPHQLSEIAALVKETVQNTTSPSLVLNNAKTSSVSRKYRVQVTGVTLTPTATLSVGRDRKRLLKSQVHRYLNGQLSAEETVSLRGMLAYVHSIEPDFLERLRKKYGADQLTTLFRRQDPKG